jgi:hypothetical protein
VARKLGQLRLVSSSNFRETAWGTTCSSARGRRSNDWSEVTVVTAALFVAKTHLASGRRMETRFKGLTPCLGLGLSKAALLVRSEILGPIWIELRTLGWERSCCVCRLRTTSLRISHVIQSPTGLRRLYY